jgi:hypothetical protein
LKFEEKTVEQDPELRQYGGAVTRVKKYIKVFDAENGVWKYEVLEATTTIDFRETRSETTRVNAGVLNPMQPPNVVAHEAGHGYADMMGWWNPPSEDGKQGLTPANLEKTNAASLEWENVTRPSTDKRKNH